MNVKQNTETILLVNLIGGDEAWGRKAGRAVHEQLLLFIEEHPQASVFRISLNDVSRLDASFINESVIQLARRYRGEKGICLVDMTDPSLIDNWEAAAVRSDQPLLLWMPSGDYKLIGPALSEGMRPLFEIVVKSDGVTTGEAADQLEQTVQNVSNKMRAIWEQGYVLRMGQTALTGGIEFRYIVPK